MIAPQDLSSCYKLLVRQSNKNCSTTVTKAFESSFQMKSKDMRATFFLQSGSLKSSRRLCSCASDDLFKRYLEATTLLRVLYLYYLFTLITTKILRCEGLLNVSTTKKLLLLPDRPLSPSSCGSFIFMTSAE